MNPRAMHQSATMSARLIPPSSERTDAKSGVPQFPVASEVRFRDYSLENIYLRTTPAQRAEIIALWQEQQAISDCAETIRRSKEAVFLVRAAFGRLVGLSTAGFVRVPDGRIFYAYRMFLHQQHRVPYLMVTVILATRDFLRTFQHPKLQPAGMLHVNENPRLMRPGIRKLFQRHGYRYWGKTPHSEDIWAVEFCRQTGNPALQSSWRQTLKKLAQSFRQGRDGIPKLTVISGEP